MKLCCIFNYNPLYRFPIYNAIAEEFEADFYFGDTVFETLKQFDPNKLKGFRHLLQVRKFRSWMWYRNTKSLFSSRYDTYLITGAGNYITNWILILYCKLSKKRIFGWTHGIKEIPQNPIILLMNKLFYKSLDGIFMYNRHNCQYMHLIGVKDDKLHVIHNSLDTQLQTTIYQDIKSSSIYKDHFQNNNPTIIYIGRIQERKKVGQLLDAVEVLKNRGVQVNVILVGGNVNDIEIDKKIRMLNIDNHIWTYGPCFDEKLTAELLYNADVCVCPAEVGLTAIHSLSYGTPVISNDNFNTQMPEFESIEVGKTGSFFKENDIEDLAIHIEKWINLPYTQRCSIRDNARKEILENWSVQSQITLLKQNL